MARRSLVEIHVSPTFRWSTRIFVVLADEGLSAHYFAENSAELCSAGQPGRLAPRYFGIFWESQPGDLRVRIVVGWRFSVLSWVVSLEWCGRSIAPRITFPTLRTEREGWGARI